MEKLQKALDKARQERVGKTSVRGRAVASARIHPGESAPRNTTDELWAGLPVFEPDIEHLERNRIMAYTAKPDATVFDILRTKIFLTMRQNGWTRVAVTSPDTACGKTTISCNLAAGFTRQKEVRTILLDMDLRRPGADKALGCRPEHDLREVLLGQVAPHDQMLRLCDNVALALSRTPVQDPTQLLLSETTTQALDGLQRLFAPDIMIFDLSPMLVTDDARTVLKNVDCALIVARSESTSIARLDVCEREVAEHTNVLGVVLNDCRNITKEDSHSSYYD